MSYLQDWILTYTNHDPKHKVEKVAQNIYSRHVSNIWKDGKLFAEALANINEEWFSRIRKRFRPNAHLSWMFMKGNLERLLKSVQGYYRLHLGLILERIRIPDLVKIARTGDPVEVDRMIVLVLGCAVTCPERGGHITRILSSGSKMKTEILNQITSLGLERTFLNLKMTEASLKMKMKSSTVANYSDERYHRERKCDIDSGIEDDQYHKNCIHQINLTNIQALTSSNSGVLETSFEVDSVIDPENESTKSCSKVDFSCQFDANYYMKTSEIIDVDDEICEDFDFYDHEMVDESLDPIFGDKSLMETLKNEIRLLVSKLENSERINMNLEDENWELKQKYGENEKILLMKNDEIEILKTSLELAQGETQKLENLIKETKLNGSVTIKDLQKMLDTLKVENSELREENKELEERHWSLEMLLRKQNFTKNIIMVTNPDAVSTSSSGFASGGFDLPEPSTESSGEILTVRNNFELMKLQVEAERLSDLLGVMEEREEQLLGQVRTQETARQEAEFKVKETKLKLARREAADQLGDKMKKVLLLTAAFGAVHSALNNDLVMGGCNML